MPVTHIVAPGEGLTSIAAKYGFLPETLWAAPENTALKMQRKNPEMLAPGDAIHIPDKDIKHQELPANVPQEFVAKGAPANLAFKLLDHHGEPRANQPYVLSLNGKLVNGVTDAQGFVRQPVPPDLKKATLFLKDGAEKIPVKLNGVPPLNSPMGAQSRLHNLGFLKGPVQKDMHPDALKAVSKFQKLHGLPPTGKLDPQTLKKLEDVHGS